MAKKGSKKSARPSAAAISPKPQGLSEQLNSLYLKLPVIPYLDRSTSTILCICLLAYAIFMAGVFVLSPVHIEQALVEGPLVKNTQLQLLPGETYYYESDSPDGAQAAAYEVSREQGCAGITVTDVETLMRLCLSKSGNLLEDGFPMVNSTLGNKSIALFSPWMLAVSDSFSWGFKTTFSASGTTVEMPVSMKSLGRKTIAGREAYEISVESGSGLPSLFYIDSQKRVLLSLEADNFTLKLMSAPFELNWSNATAQN